MKCKTCGNEFELRAGNQIYCKAECRPTGKIYTLKCVICKKEFKNGCDTVMTCSKGCLKQLMINRKKEKPVPLSDNVYNSTEDARLIVKPIIKYILNKSMGGCNSINGKTIDYRNITFGEKIKSEVLERDNYRCRICNGGVNLHIHHIIPRQFGGSHDEDNLITLCAKCHMHIETGDADHAIQKCAKNYLIVINNKISIPRNSFSTREIMLRQNEFLKNVFKRLSNIDNKNLETKEILCSIDNFLENIKVEK